MVIATTLLVIIFYAFFVISKDRQYVASSAIMLNPPSFERYVSARLTAGPSVSQVVMLPQNQLRKMQSWGIAEKVAEEINKKEKIKITTEEVHRSRTITLQDQTIIKIDTTSSNREKAKYIANYYADVGIEENKNLSNKEYQDGIKFIAEKVEGYKKKLEKMEDNIRDFNQKFGSLDFSQDVMSKIKRLSDYEAAKENIGIEKEEGKRIIQQLKLQLQQEGATLASLEEIPNPELQNYKAQLYPLELELMKLKDHYTDEHPKVIAQKEKINIINKKIKQEVAKFIEVEKEIENPRYSYLTHQLINQEMNFISQGVRAEALSEIIKKEKETLSHLSREEVEYAELIREKQTAEKQYTTLQEMLEVMYVQEAMKKGNAEILDKSQEAQEIPRTSPQQFLFIFLIGAFISMFVGISLEFLDDTVKTPYEVKKYLNLTTLGVIPKIKDYDLRIIYNLSPKSPVTETYNKIAYHLQKICLDTNSKTIVVTSAKGEEGKTTVISNLALALSQTGENIILVDADLRKPTIHRIFNLSNAYGLSSLVSGEAQSSLELQKIQMGEKITSPSLPEVIDKLIQKNGKWNLSILPGGPLVPNPIEILTKNKMEEVVAYLKKNYTKVLFDSPPLLSVIDSAILASHLDGALIILDSSSVKRGEAFKIKQTLANLKVKIFGVILNNSEVEPEEYYYYYRSYPQRRK